MAGGIGSRFWPISTAEKPKQFLDILGTGKSLLQITYDRLIQTIPKENIYILTNTDYIELVKEQIKELEEEQILAEPQRKNTAPCIAYASAKIHSMNSQATLVISPSDHLIIDTNKFSLQLQRAIEEAQKEKLVVLGIKPTRPDTGYGYIEFFSNKKTTPGDVVSVVRFCEKPNKTKAKEFLNNGNFFWNAGIFIVQTKTIKQSFKKHAKQLYASFFTNSYTYWTNKEKEHISAIFSSVNSISFDYAIMEKAKNISMVLTDFDWSDLGSWRSVKDHVDLDENNNALIGNKSMLFESKNCLFYGVPQKKYLIEGLENYILVDSEDKLLIMPLEKEELLKERLKSIGEKT